MLHGFRMASFVGDILVAVDDDGALAHLEFDGGRSSARLAATLGAVSTDPPPVATEVARQLAEYFDGTRHIFDLPLAPTGTPFQLAVWRALGDIPFGRTESYGQLAARIGKPAAVRAVGRANGQNPISIVVPCHRVIGADGSLTGYGGGMERKQALLDHEGARGQLSLFG